MPRVKTAPIRSRTAAAAPPAARRKKKRKPGEVAQKDTHRYQGAWHHGSKGKFDSEGKNKVCGVDTTKLLMPKAPFLRLVKEITQEITSADIRWQKAAAEALQESAEACLANLFSDTQLAAAHARRKTIMVKDMRLVRRIRREVMP